MYILGDIGNTETKLCIVSKNNKILKKINFISKSVNISQLNSLFKKNKIQLSFDYNNNISYLTPEEISALNEPIGQFTGSRAVTGSATMYLRTGDLESAGFLRNISEDSRTSSAQTSNANLIIGGATAPYVAFQLDACQFEFPSIATDDVISMSVNFVGQEPTATKGDGGEVTIFAKK